MAGVKQAAADQQPNPALQPHTPARPRRHRRSRRGRAIVLSGLLFIAMFQVGLNWVIDYPEVEWRDPEYGFKLLRLQQQQRESPGRPLILVLGSSRSAQGFSPAALRKVCPATQQAPLVFNFALSGAGPMTELLCLRRLLREGVRPQQIFLEIHPALLHQGKGFSEENWLDISRLTLRDLPVLVRYGQQSVCFYCRQWCSLRLMPCFTYRFGLMGQLAPSWLPVGTWPRRVDDIDSLGWQPHGRKEVTPEQYCKGVEFARQEYIRPLTDFCISEVANRALREQLALCQRERIAVSLVLMPEGSEFRSWFAPPACAAINAYLAGLSQEYGVPVIDARCWMADNDFCDSHHLLPGSAARFTERFGREVLRPMLAQK